MFNTIAEKISRLNRTTLESLSENDRLNIIRNFTETSIKILDADFGFAWWRLKNDESYELAYKHPRTPYEPNLPRKRGGNYAARKTGNPIFVSKVKAKDYEKKYDVSPYMKSYVIVPVTYENKIYGNIIICFKQQKTFTNEDKSLCAALGNSAAQAITIHQFHSHLEDLVAKRTQQLKIKNEELKRDRAEDQAILTSIGEGLIATNGKGEVIFMNPQAVAIINRKEKDIIGKVVYVVQPLVDEKNNLVPVAERPTYLALTKGQSVSTSKYSYTDKNGNNVPLSITASPVRMDGKIVGAIQVFRDISKEREIDRAKSELISLASHQLRTPLAGINWYVEALIKEEVGQLNKEQKKYLGEVHRANHKLVEMVYDFLNVSRIELGTFNLKISVVDVKDVTRGILNELEPTIAAKRLKINERYQGQLNAVRLDHKVIRLILQNLITNAVKYTPAKGKIEIEIKEIEPRKSEPAISITITDTGVGIPKNDQEKIFSKLFRADNIKTLDSDGSGLGLYIAKSFTELCRGEIKFASKEGKGTKFFVTLPVAI